MQDIPVSIDAEQSVIGGLLIDNDKFDEVSEIIITKDFHTVAHQLIYSKIAALLKNNQPCDLITVSDALTNAGYLEQVGGFAYIAELCKNTPSVANILAYAKIVADKSRARRLIQVGQSLIDNAIDRDLDIKSAISECEEKLFLINQRDSTETTTNIQSELIKIFEDIETRGNKDITGTTSGFTELDRFTCGFQKSDLIILAARPSMGKTSLALNFCLNALETHDMPVHIYSMEMPSNQILERCLSTLGNVPFQNIRSGMLSDDDCRGITIASQKMLEQFNHKLILDDSGSLTPNQLRSRARRNTRKYGQPCLIMVDYIQLMRSSGKENRNQEIADISRSLKALAKELDCPILALSQLNRSLESRADKRPNNGDLRDSGSLEQDADLIMFIYRDEVYNELSLEKGVAEIIIGKQRNGPIGRAKLKFNGNFVRFENFEGGSYDFGC